MWVRIKLFFLEYSRLEVNRQDAKYSDFQNALETAFGPRPFTYLFGWLKAKLGR